MNIRVMNRVLCMLLVGTIVVTATAQLDLSWHTVDGGGAIQSSGGPFSMSATVGQPDASGVMAGGSFEMTGGFWFRIPPTDCNADGAVNIFDYNALEACMSGPGGGLLTGVCACFDINNDGDVAVDDFARLQIAFDPN